MCPRYAKGVFVAMVCSLSQCALIRGTSGSGRADLPLAGEYTSQRLEMGYVGFGSEIWGSNAGVPVVQLGWVGGLQWLSDEVS